MQHTSIESSVVLGNGHKWNIICKERQHRNVVCAYKNQITLTLLRDKSSIQTCVNFEDIITHIYIFIYFAHAAIHRHLLSTLFYAILSMFYILLTIHWMHEGNLGFSILLKDLQHAECSWLTFQLEDNPLYPPAWWSHNVFKGSVSEPVFVRSLHDIKIFQIHKIHSGVFVILFQLKTLSKFSLLFCP